MVATLLVAACSSSGDWKKKIGLVRETPNEFEVVVNPPLTVPPHYNYKPEEDGQKFLNDDVQRIDDGGYTEDELNFINELKSQSSNAPTRLDLPSK